MKKIEDGGPAFPFGRQPYQVDGIVKTEIVRNGLTVRQHYAAAALQGLLSNPYVLQNITEKSEADNGGYAEIADMALDQADAMLAAEKQNNQTKE